VPLGLSFYSRLGPFPSSCLIGFYFIPMGHVVFGLVTPTLGAQGAVSCWFHVLTMSMEEMKRSGRSNTCILLHPLSVFWKKTTPLVSLAIPLSPGPCTPTLALLQDAWRSRQKSYLLGKFLASGMVPHLRAGPQGAASLALTAAFPPASWGSGPSSVTTRAMFWPVPLSVICPFLNWVFCSCVLLNYMNSLNILDINLLLDI
jgi:hypothetical protein